MGLTATDPIVIPPTIVLDDRYELGPRLGGGGASDVYRAYDHRLGRQVAVKLFRDRVGAHSDRRCGEEARLLAALSHPALVNVYDAGWYDDREYLVLQLVEGATLARRITGVPLPVREMARIGGVLADALDHVHSRGIVHRDVKPSNILCGDDGGVFLADFGISHPTGMDDGAAVGTVVGTAQYLAPEQVTGAPASPAADIYALGLVLLECLTGRREYPTSPGGQRAAAFARLHREPVVPSDVPEPVGGLIRRMTARDPGARPGAAECRSVLATVLLGTPSSERIPSPGGAPSPGGSLVGDGGAGASSHRTGATPAPDPDATTTVTMGPGTSNARSVPAPAGRSDDAPASEAGGDAPGRPSPSGAHRRRRGRALLAPLAGIGGQHRTGRPAPVAPTVPDARAS